MIGGYIDAKVVEQVEHQGTYDGNAVLEIGVQVGIAADRGDAVDRQWHLDALVVFRIGGVAGYATSVGIGELEVDAAGNVAVRCRAANVESAQLVFAASIEAVVGRGHIAAESLHVAKLCPNAQHIVAVV